MKYELLSARSPSMTLNVLQAALPVITSVNWPTSPKPQGTSLSIVINWKNNGGDGVMFARLVDYDTGGVIGTTTISAAAGQTSSTTFLTTMPSRDLRLIAQVGTNTTVTQSVGPTTIELSVSVATSLSLAISPTSAKPQSTVGWSGKLSRTDGKAPGIQAIKLWYSSEKWGEVQTDANGNYSGTFTAPKTAGAYPVEAVFDGGVVGTLALLPSASMKQRMLVGEEKVDKLALLITGLLGAGGLYFIMKGK